MINECSAALKPKGVVEAGGCSDSEGVFQGGGVSNNRQNFQISFKVKENRGVLRIWEGEGGQEMFLNLEICMSKPCALLRRFGGMLPR